MLRYATAYITTAANASEQSFTVTTLDDYRVRHIKVVYMGISTSGVQLGLYTAGQWYSYIDGTRFANGNQPLPVEFDVQPKIQLTVSLKNLAGAALTSVPIVVGYEVDPGTGP